MGLSEIPLVTVQEPLGRRRNGCREPTQAETVEVGEMDGGAMLISTFPGLSMVPGPEQVTSKCFLSE